jgi:hypothetical protein
MFVPAYHSIAQVGTLFFYHACHQYCSQFNDKEDESDVPVTEQIVPFLVQNKPLDDCHCLCVYFLVFSTGAKGKALYPDYLIRWANSAVRPYANQMRRPARKALS